jgi:RND family efflux transporter MFP subunit
MRNRKRLFVSLIVATATLTGCPGQKQQEGKISLPTDSPVVKSQPEKEPSEAATSQIENSPKEAAVQKPTAQLASSGTAGTGISEGKQISARISGTVTVARQGQVSFKVAGHISKANVRVGDRIKKGEALAVLDDKDYILRQRLAKVSVELAKVNMEQGRRDLAREEQLKKENVTTQTALERIQTNVTNAQLQLSQAQLNLEQIEKALADTKLVAPFDGVIAKQLKVEGEFVGVGNAVYELSDIGQIEVTLKVPETYLGRLKVGEQVSLTLPSLNKSSKMRVTRVVPIVQENSRTFEVIGRIEGDTNAILPGQFVEAQL